MIRESTILTIISDMAAVYLFIIVSVFLYEESGKFWRLEQSCFVLKYKPMWHDFFPDGLTSDTIFSLDSVEGQCSDGFISHGNSCYHFSHDTETWLDAELSCQQVYGAHLAEIEDASENNFLINQVNVIGFPFWVGGNDLQIEGEWKWFASKTAVKYSTWHPGNPSNSNGDENCMEILDGDGRGPQLPLWNDKQCHAFQRYICEKSTGESEIVG